jgi:hypothetical protein
MTLHPLDMNDRNSNGISDVVRYGWSLRKEAAMTNFAPIEAEAATGKAAQLLAQVKIPGPDAQHDQEDGQ